ncbi:uncharacterized protein EI90DRAFT_3043257 [Cantharellus anzutake]|uniref:uncharacterized protein n=1 Tax=Cantharellus anzutake TaxID=1750568 RepID=UPI001906970F|nr:uncharacterized protein EI90DRAFT_3043257 [Cantharellus anzutake]KAF8337520.1 hypothetical protein EI90DRAFT_3043257 [Cantharellus anzutake]
MQACISKRSLKEPTISSNPVGNVFNDDKESNARLPSIIFPRDFCFALLRDATAAAVSAAAHGRRERVIVGGGRQALSRQCINLKTVRDRYIYMPVELCLKRNEGWLVFCCPVEERKERGTKLKRKVRSCTESAAKGDQTGAHVCLSARWCDSQAFSCLASRCIEN